ncbi:MAG: S8 family serine peptidase [Solirubrobacteraceae bacterium]
MRRLLFTIALGVAVAVLSVPVASSAAGAPTSAAGLPPLPPAASVPTGALMVLLEQHRGRIASAARASVDAGIARLGAKPAGKSVPEIGLITVRAPAGVSTAALAAELKAIPGVASVQPERRYVPRATPNDPGYNTVDQNEGVPYQWYLTDQGFPRAWDISNGSRALVGVIDSGIDATHPDLASKLAVAPIDQQVFNSTGPAGTDQVGHGTHVASLACAATNNGIGIAGAGDDCRLVIEKTDFTDSSIAQSIVDATNKHVGALNMSFGPDPSAPPAPAPESEVRALEFAAVHKVVLVAAAADSPVTEQGDPANVLQPAGTGADITKGIGLDVTAAQFGAQHASFAGVGSEISLAAYGAFNPNSTSLIPCMGQPIGILGAYPSTSTQLEQPPDPAACRVSLNGSTNYATVAGTSMAAPQVAAVGAMMRALNPYASLQDLLEIIKRTAQRPAGSGWSSENGWGILNAGAALDATRHLDRLAPISRIRAPRVTSRRTLVLRWSGNDQQHAGLTTSGIAYYLVYVSVNGGRPRRLARTGRHTLKFRTHPDSRYVFWTVAVDKAGNREVKPVRLRTRVPR